MFGSSNQTNQIDHEVFIRAIRDRPALWQVKHPEHRNQRIKRALWTEIQQSFPIIVDVEDLKKKWKNLKDSYRKELRKISVLQSSDPLATNIQSQWVHYRYLDFLKDEIMAKEGWETFEPQETQNYLAVKLEPQDRIITAQNYREYQPIEPHLAQRITPNSPRRSSSSSEHSEPNATKKRLSANDLRTEYLDIERKKLKILEKELTLQNIEARELTKSDDYHYLMSILPEMSKLPPLQKMKLRNRINEILMEQMQEAANGNCYADMKNFNVS